MSRSASSGRNRSPWIAGVTVLWSLSLVGYVIAQSDGPRFATNPNIHRTGTNLANGREVFRFETFGNERFWTDAVRLPAGMLATNFTPLVALRNGLHIDSEMVPAALRDALVAELRTDLSAARAPLLNNVMTTVALLNANAVIGLPAKDTNGDGIVNIMAGDKVGATCALCHTITDNSVVNMPNGGSIGRRQDGRAPHTLNFGNLVATGTNSLAYYPALQLALTANGGATLGRAPRGLTENSTEADADAYLSNPQFYPPGMFDDTVDGNGDPMHNAPLFRTDLGAPWGSDGTIQFLDNFSNLVYTALLDPTVLTTPGGRGFLRLLGGAAAGEEIVSDYLQILARTGVTGFPFVQASPHPQPGSEAAPLGVRVDNTKLLDMNAYLNSLPAPPGVVEDEGAVARGRARFRINCTFCHNVDQSIFVPPAIVGMRFIFPGDNPTVLLPQRMAPLNPIVDTPGNIFDDKMAVVNASLRGLERGTALPLLLDLARKPVFLHDNSVPSLEALLDPSRGPTAPHPFYLSNQGHRDDIVAFLRSLSTTSSGTQR
jgi:cytochrome c2